MGLFKRKPKTEPKPIMARFLQNNIGWEVVI